MLFLYIVTHKKKMNKLNLKMRQPLKWTSSVVETAPETGREKILCIALSRVGNGRRE